MNTKTQTDRLPTTNDRPIHQANNPWSTTTANDSAQRWRILAGPARVLVNPGRSDTFGAYMAFENGQNFVDGLMRPQIKENCAPGPGDQKDLARWMGGALAKENNRRRVTSGIPISPDRHQDMYWILERLIQECAAVAWVGYDIPNWSEEDLYLSRCVLEPDIAGIYRPWGEVCDDLLTLIETFHQQSTGSWRPTWDNNAAMHGCLALRLLAGVAPGRVPEKVVHELVWLEQNIQSSVYTSTHTKELRGLILVTWERSLLERVSRPADEDDQTSRPRPRMM